LDVITELNKLDKKILNETNVIIFPKTPDKKKQYEELYLQTFYLNKIDAKKAINLLRTMMQIKKIYVNEEMNAIVIRDTPDVIALAEMLDANDILTQVVLEVEVRSFPRKTRRTRRTRVCGIAGFNSRTPFRYAQPASLPSGSSVINLLIRPIFSSCFNTISSAAF
jgi:hypothetical protein